MIYPDWLGFHLLRKPVETGGGGYSPPIHTEFPSPKKPIPKINIDLLSTKEIDNNITINVSPLIKQDL